MNYENWQYHESKLPKDETERKKLLEQLAVQFREELLANEAACHWLSQQKEEKREYFIKSYIDKKILVIDASSYFISKAEQVPELRFREETEKSLDLILHKKLFNLQCQWRAGNIELPGISICFDFICWAQDIRNCPFLDPITKEELELLRTFVLIDNFWLDSSIDEDGVANRIYEEITERNEQGQIDMMPNWFEYYDQCMGTDTLVMLPNIRGEKEQKYLDAVRNKNRSELAGQAVTHIPYTPSDTIHNYYDDYYSLACCFDDEYYKTLLKAARDEESLVNQLEHQDQTWDDYSHLLTNIPNLPPVRGGLSWRQALRWCYQDYVSSVIYEDLPVVWESYMLYRSMGIQTTSANAAYIDMHKNMREDVLKRILDGRELLGEPRDLNF